MTRQHLRSLGIAAAVFSLIALVGTVTVPAQEESTPVQEEREPYTEIVLVGHLETDEIGAFVLIERSSGESISLVSSIDLGQYLGSEIQAVGTWAEDSEGYRYFVVDRVQKAALGL